MKISMLRSIVLIIAKRIVNCVYDVLLTHIIITGTYTGTWFLPFYDIALGLDCTCSYIRPMLSTGHYLKAIHT